MARKAAPVDVEAPKTRMGLLFSTTRQIVIFTFFIFWCCLDVSFLGLISEQLNKHGNDASGYPSGMYYHALGLGLCAAIVGLLFGIFHFVLNHMIFLFLFLALGVFYGTVAGILLATPFGHGLQCKYGPEHFPANYQPYADQCSRILAIEGLAWALFGLAVIGFFFTVADKFSCTSRRSSVYIPYQAPEKIADHKHHDEESL